MTLRTEMQWQRVLLEGVVVVGSILLAFGIDSWWDARQERKTELEILAGLEADFTENETELAVHVQTREWLLSIADNLARQIQGAPPGTEVAVADSVLMGLMLSPTFDPVTSTLDGTIASGRTTVIRSGTVRHHLADWQRELVGLHENELAVRDVVHFLVVPELSSLTRLGPASSALASPGNTTPTDSRPLRTTSELEGAVGMLLFHSTQVRRALRRIGEIQSALLAELRAELSH